MANVTRELFHAISPTVVGQTAAPAFSRVLVPMSKGSRSATSRASTQGKASSSSKFSVASRLKSTSTLASWEPITINESIESGSKGGTEVAPLATQSCQAAATIVISGDAGKRA